MGQRGIRVNPVACTPVSQSERKEAIPVELILVVCGAGASSTFLAARLRKLATERGLDVTARAGSASELPGTLNDAAVILVGPHLEAEFPAITAMAREYSIPAALLPTTAFGPGGAVAAFDTALSLLTAATASENLDEVRAAQEGSPRV